MQKKRDAKLYPMTLNIDFLKHKTFPVDLFEKKKKILLGNPIKKQNKNTAVNRGSPSTDAAC